MDSPDLSVVVLVDEERERGARCLQSILQQANVDRLEVLLVDVAHDTSEPLPGSEHPSVRVLNFSKSLWFGQLQAEAVRSATAPIVAFLEEHCVALPGWSGALLDAHRGPDAAVGGERHEPSSAPPLARFVQLLDRGPWSPPATAQATLGLPAGNVAYKREILLRYSEHLDLYFESEGLLQARLLADGWTLRVAPLAKYCHDSDSHLWGLCRRWYGQGYMAGLVHAKLRGGQRRPAREDVRRWLKTLMQGPWILLTLVTRGPDRGFALSRAHVALLLSVTTTAGDVAGMVLGRLDSDVRVRHELLNGRRRLQGGG